MPSNFVLVPGACHSSACWQRIVPLLEKHGHAVITPKLLGIGTDHTPLSEVDLASWVGQIVDVVEKQSESIILVGHSREGIIISEVAEHVPKKIKLLVYLTAFLAPSGATLADSSAKSDSGDPVIVNADGTYVFAPDKIVPYLYNKTSPEWVERISSLISPEPLKVCFTPLKLTDDHYGLVPRAYVECAEDHIVPLAHQRFMQSRLPCKYVITLDSNHSPFFSAPVELVPALIDLASKT